MTLHLTIDLRAVLIGVVLLLVAGGIATPFAISLADDGPAGDRVSEQRVAAPLGTAFTYQGRLDTGGAPATGSYDLRFRLYEDIDGATALGAGFFDVPDVPVTNGLFTVDLEFGAAPFAGQARFLEVRVRPGAETGPYTPLVPLQRLSPTPYALYANASGTANSATTASIAPWAGLTGVPAGFLDGVDADTLGGLSCASGQVPKRQGIAWICGEDIAGLTYSAGPGLTLSGPQFAVQFPAAGSVNGNATTPSRSDHTHVGQTWTGIVAPGLVVAYAGSHSALVGQWGGCTSLGFNAGVTGCATTSGVGIAGKIGNCGESFNTAVSGCNILGGTAVRGEATSGIAVRGSSQSSTGVYGSSTPGYGVHGFSSSNYAVYGESALNDAVVGKGGSGFAGILGFSRNGANTYWGGYFVGNLGVEGSVTSSSDLRLKRNVVPVEHGLDAVQRLRPVSFAWRNSADGNQHMGFLAQDVQEVFPDLVVEGRDGMLMLEYSGIIPVLTKAIQEQQAQIEALKAGAAAGTRDEGPTSEPHTTTARESVSASPLNGWALPGAVALFALGLFVVAGALVRRRS